MNPFKVVLSLLTLILPQIAAAHCLVPETAAIEFFCENHTDNLTVKFLIFSEKDPRNCAGMVTIERDESGSSEQEFIVHNVKVDPREYGRTDISADFDQVSEIIVSYRESRAFPGLIQFAENSSTALICVEGI